ncbi:MAG: MaoC family dehydratase [Acidobacteriota bacterium]|nr:MaoC family dehydratase [Acidobacteriota bacterium]MDH3530250.1 MaoC family dehydratase [Acidobacteriota bacterium]
MTLKTGDKFEVSKQVTDELIRQFAEVSGDTNPIHLDEEFAANTRFGKRIGHGMLTASFISALLGSSLSVTKIVYLGQTLKFKAPVFIGDTVTATGTVTKIRKDKPIVTVETICRNQNAETVIEGEAVLMLLD